MLKKVFAIALTLGLVVCMLFGTVGLSDIGIMENSLSLCDYDYKGENL